MCDEGEDAVADAGEVEAEVEGGVKIPRSALTRDTDDVAAASTSAFACACTCW